MRSTVRRRPPGRSVGYYKRYVALGASNRIESDGRAVARVSRGSHASCVTFSSRTMKTNGPVRIFYRARTRRSLSFIGQSPSNVSKREETYLYINVLVDTKFSAFALAEPSPSRVVADRLAVRLGIIRGTTRRASAQILILHTFTSTALPRVGVARPNGSYVARTHLVCWPRDSLSSWTQQRNRRAYRTFTPRI